MATTSDLTVINAAATRTGNEPVSALTTSGGPVAAMALNNYEDIVRAELSNYPWKRASKTTQLDRVDPDTMGAPPAPWTAAYQLPNDLVEIRTVKVAGYTITYEVHGDKILCNADEGDDVILHYIWRVPEANWPAWFREGMVRRMEAIFLRGIGERHDQAAARDKSAQEQFAVARNRDSQSQTQRNPEVSPTLAARGGFVVPPPNRFFPPR